MQDMTPTTIVFYIVAAIMAITFHEAAHGWVAWKRGDPTAFQQGRVTFNPLSHIDPVGTIFLPLMLALSHLPMFGWARPVPVNEGRLKSPRWDGALVSIAGIAANLILAVFFALSLRLTAEYVPPGGYQENLITFLLLAVQLNLVFAVFNLLPFPPLDGYRFFSTFLPTRARIALARIERHGLWLVLFGLLLLPWLLKSFTGLQFDPLRFLVVRPVMFLQDALFGVVGLV